MNAERKVNNIELITGGFQKPEEVRYYFSQDTLPLEFFLSVKKSKAVSVVVEIPPDHPILGSEVACRWLAMQFEKIDKDILIDVEDGEMAALLRDCGFELLQDRTAPTKRSMMAPSTPLRTASGFAQVTVGGQSDKKEKYFRERSKKKKELNHTFLSPPEEENQQNGDDMRRSAFSMPGRRSKSRVPWYVWFLLTAVVAGVFLFTAVLPRAEVVIIPETNEVKQVKSASVRASWQESQKEPAHIRGKLITADAQVESTTPVTELSQTGEAAKGEVMITNKSGQETNLPEGSMLTSDDGVEYVLPGAVVVPPATVLKDNTIKFGTARVAVQAKVRGARSNRDTGTLTLQAVPAHRRDRIYADIAQPITGGRDEQGKMVSEEHVVAAKDALTRDLFDALTKMLAERVPPEWLIDSSFATATVTQTIVLPPVGTVSDDFSLRLLGTSRALSVSRADTLRLFGVKPETCQDAERAGIDLCTIQITKVRKFDASQETADADISLTRTVYPAFNLDEMKERVRGMSIADARRELLGSKGVRDVRINMRMSLRNFLPKDDSRVTVRVEK